MQREGESKLEHAYKNSVDVENTDGEEIFRKRERWWDVSDHKL